MGSWFWLNIPLALLFFCCWTGIPLWLTLTRWNVEINAKHAEISARNAAVAAEAVLVVAHAASAGTLDTGTRPVPELSAS
jgi:hypothetical protein